MLPPSGNLNKPVPFPSHSTEDVNQSHLPCHVQIYLASVQEIGASGKWSILKRPWACLATVKGQVGEKCAHPPGLAQFVLLFVQPH